MPGSCDSSRVRRLDRPCGHHERRRVLRYRRGRQTFWQTANGKRPFNSPRGQPHQSTFRSRFLQTPRELPVAGVRAPHDRDGRLFPSVLSVAACGPLPRPQWSAKGSTSPDGRESPVLARSSWRRSSEDELLGAAVLTAAPAQRRPTWMTALGRPGTTAFFVRRQA
jgi:hypothetical protein